MAATQGSQLSQPAATPVTPRRPTQGGTGLTPIAKHPANVASMQQAAAPGLSMNEEELHAISMASMPEGMTMDGEKLQAMFKENKETKVPLRHLMKKYFPEVNLVTNIEPADGFPDKKTRNKR